MQVQVKMANLQQKKYMMWVVTAQESVKTQQFKHPSSPQTPAGVYQPPIKVIM